MFQLGPYEFRYARSDEDLEAVHRLNGRTFAREIPQHPAAAGDRLVDRFHAKNHYLVAAAGGRVVGMVAATCDPPFSVAARLPDPSVLAAPGVRPMEVRLLAVEPDCRGSVVLPGLLWAVYRHGRSEGRTHLFISALTTQRRLYEHIGFEPLGTAVQGGGAWFVPMRVALDRVDRVMGRVMSGLAKRAGSGGRPTGEPVCLLPGPVAVTPAVRAAFAAPPESHRAASFTARFEGVRRRLCRLTNTRGVVVLAGGGTLANEAVAATLAAAPGAGDGLVLVNGEFGGRLLRQARRWGLRPRTLEWPWGRPWDLDEVAAAVRRLPAGGWVWGVHHETSTGVLNDLPGLVRAPTGCGVRVCADGVSAVGAEPVDYAGAYLATGVSGKAVGAYAGLALVFADPARLAGVDVDRLPTYLDVPAGLAAEGPRFTVPSPLVRALDAALDGYETPARFTALAAAGGEVRGRLRAMGAGVVADDTDACPVLTTFVPPAGESSEGFVRRCEGWGFHVAGRSGYLAERRWVQVATMGDVDPAAYRPLLDRLAALDWGAPFGPARATRPSGRREAAQPAGHNGTRPPGAAPAGAWQ